MWAPLGLAFSLIMISGCTLNDMSSSSYASGGRISPTYQGPAEASYCSTSTNYTGSTSTISGTAKFTRRNAWGDSTSGGLGSASTSGTHAATQLPIRRAEVRVTDPSGAVVQCAETLNDGTFSFVLPRGSVPYTLSINSRANNTYLVASVLNRPEQNLFFSLTTSVTPTLATHALGTLNAAADGDTLGGAFNILDQLLRANEYLLSEIGSTCGGHLAEGCPAFSVAPKVTAYWELGFNPNSYFGSNGGLSFYLPGYSRLFILGGINGNVNSADTDHFDNSVIVHEYGHFLEDSMFASDSLGGSHNGNAVIDPRLAWSEGWGNFFQAAVTNQALYIDTTGNDDGSTDMAYYADLESADRDVPAFAGEGNFREFSVTRLLWDAIDANADGPTNGATDNVVSSEFSEIWAALMKTTKGFRDSNFAFRNIGHLHYAQQSLTGASDWTTIRTIERQDGNTSQYAQYRTPQGGGCAVTSISSLNGGNPGNSHLLRDNDFYHIHISSSGSYTFLLTYNDTGGGGTLDLDLYLYNEDAEFGSVSDLLAKSNADPSGTANQTEQFTVTLAPGNYLLNVSSFSGSPETGTYTLKQNGTQLCLGTL